MDADSNRFYAKLECLQRMEAAGMDEELIEYIGEQLQWRGEEEKEVY